jgi:hypothetical protein
VAPVRLENIVWDARDPHRLGRFWAAALGARLITNEPDVVEARLRSADDLFLDLCFQPVAAPSDSPSRLHLDLAGGARQHEVVQRLLELGAERADIGQGAVPGVATLRHPSGVGPLLELVPEPEPKSGKNRLHLDVRPGAGDDIIVERVLEWGATPLTDPSGNEFCILARADTGH